MLNISDNKIDRKQIEQYDAFQHIMQLNTSKKLAYWMIGLLVLLLIIIMLPWTQNIITKGKVTTLRPEHRPQSVYSAIAGKIECWYVREGESVQKGDTLAFISEVKTDYLNPQLLDNIQNQVLAKEASKDAYEEKSQALTQQLTAIGEALQFKLEQSSNKVQQYQLKLVSDSINVHAAQTAYDISVYQLNRTDTLYQQGIKSLSDLENKRNKMQATQAKLIASQNKYLSTKNELLNAKIELNSLSSQYADKMAKVRSERSSTLSNVYDANSQIAKLQNKYANYQERTKLYYIIAPQNGYITKINKKGLGELVKASEPLLSIMPEGYDLAVEAYIRPMDYPLLNLEQEVRFVFDGWPAFVFSGWPNQSYGTFSGKVIAIDNVANEKGNYRILVAPDSKKAWPSELRVGAGANTLIMLNDVPLWYEFWRQLNGFPPDFYEAQKSEKVKLKAPINHLKK